MTWQLIITILTSSLGAAFFTKSLDIYTANITYKRDYYKKIIDERLKVYLKLSQVLYQAVHNVVKDGVVYIGIFGSPTQLYNFISDLMGIADSRIFLGTITANKLKELLELLATDSVAAGIKKTSADIEAQAFGVNMTPIVNKLIRELEALALADMKNLHNVDAFFNSN